ncbi:glycosyl transferase [Planctomycetales bacterium]|nr:glycosyl transferase [Planctomycetales bacterium]
MKVLHLTASPFFGGPERVIIDLVRSQASLNVESLVSTFREDGNGLAFIGQLKKEGIPNKLLNNDMPHLYAAYKELTQLLKDEHIDILLAHGHKARMVGWRAARKAGIPIIGVSHGWTGQDWKVKIYERIDKWIHRYMDKVICVSQGQADKVIKFGTPAEKITVIHNAIDLKRFEQQDDSYRNKLEVLFEQPPELLIGAAGRLSPEKGFDVLIDAVAELKNGGEVLPSFGVVLFGEGFLRNELEERVRNKNLFDIFKMPGFTDELDKYLPHFDIFAQSSHTEGFPCVNIEAMASGVALCATAVGGVPEQIIHGETGFLVPPNSPKKFAEALKDLLLYGEKRKSMGEQSRRRAGEFTCEKQGEKYLAAEQSLLR